MSEIDQKSILQEIKVTLKKYQQIIFRDEFEGSVILGEDSDYDFCFFLTFEHDQFEICAEPRKGFDNSSMRYFWRMPIEFVAYKNDPTKAAKDFLDSIELLLTYPTKIVQKKNLFFYSFSLMYFREGIWHKHFTNACFRWSNFIVPNKTEKEIIYYGKL